MAAGVSAMTKAEMVEDLLRYNPFGGYSTAQSRKVLETTLSNYRRVSSERSAEKLGAEPTLYRIVESFPYLDREEEWTHLTLDEAATRYEDLTPLGADDVLSDIEEGVDWPMRYVDEETLREVTMTREVEPEAGDMSASDGLGR